MRDLWPDELSAVETTEGLQDGNLQDTVSKVSEPGMADSQAGNRRGADSRSGNGRSADLQSSELRGTDGAGRGKSASRAKDRLEAICREPDRQGAARRQLPLTGQITFLT